jgi:hypothetical protein
MSLVLKQLLFFFLIFFHQYLNKNLLIFFSIIVLASIPVLISNHLFQNFTSKFLLIKIIPLSRVLQIISNLFFAMITHSSSNILFNFSFINKIELSVVKINSSP